MQTFNSGRICGFHNLTGQVFRQQLRHTEAHLGLAKKRRDSLRTPEELRQHVRQMKQFFLGAIGGLPQSRCELNVRRVGVAQRAAYSVERLIYDSQPDLPVTANLYLPHQGHPPYPAVVLASGHARQAKIGYQEMARLLACNGLAALAVDPVGQGERFQLIDRDTGAQVVQWGTREHSYIGLACIALGQSIARYFAWDLIRGVDLLCERRDIDAARIAHTGTSGGGTQTCLMMMLEDRLAAAAPSCYVTERLAYMKNFHAHDAEQNFFGHIPAGFDYADFALAFAPRPLMLVGTTADFFPIEGLLSTFEQARRVYDLLDAGEACQLAIAEGPHRLGAANQRKIARFLCEQLGLGAAELQEPDEPFHPDELQCTASGQVLLDFPQLPSLMDHVAGQFAACEHLSKDQLIAHVRELLNAGRCDCPLRPKVVNTFASEQDWHIEHIVLTSEPDIYLPAVFVRPQRAILPSAATVVVGDNITCQLADDDTLVRLRHLWTGGKAILFLDTRASGSAPVNAGALDRADSDIYGPIFTVAYNAFMLGDSLVAQRGWDILRALAYLRSRSDVMNEQICVYGEDQMAMPALLAAVADQNLSAVELKGLPRSFADAFSATYYDRREVNEATVIHGMLRKFDVPDLLACVRRAVMVIE